MESVIKELKKEGLLISKPTNYGEQISVNIERTDEVMKYVDEFLSKTD